MLCHSTAAGFAYAPGTRSLGDWFLLSLNPFEVVVHQEGLFHGTHSEIARLRIFRMMLVLGVLLLAGVHSRIFHSYVLLV